MSYLNTKCLLFYRIGCKNIFKGQRFMALATLSVPIRQLITKIWRASRPILGWFLIAVGIVGIPLPIVSGVLFLLIGVSLVGPRDPKIRWARVHFKKVLRRWAALSIPIIGPLGRLAVRLERSISCQIQKLPWWRYNRPHQKHDMLFKDSPFLNQG